MWFCHFWLGFWFVRSKMDSPWCTWNKQRDRFRMLDLATRALGFSMLQANKRVSVTEWSSWCVGAFVWTRLSQSWILPNFLVPPPPTLTCQTMQVLGQSQSRRETPEKAPFFFASAAKHSAWRRTIHGHRIGKGMSGTGGVLCECSFRASMRQRRSKTTVC